jgi:hypothetical protein
MVSHLQQPGVCCVCAGDMLVDAMGYLDPSAQEQLAVISGLMRGVYGDLMEVYTYYALLGKQLVVADRWACGSSTWLKRFLSESSLAFPHCWASNQLLGGGGGLSAGSRH